MSNRMKVVYLDGSDVEFVAGARAEVEVERRFSTSFLAALGPGAKPRSEYLYCLAWAGLHYAGKEPAEFDDWLARVQDVDIIPDADEQEESSDQQDRPTRRARRPANSSN